MTLVLELIRRLLSIEWSTRFSLAMLVLLDPLNSRHETMRLKGLQLITYIHRASPKLFTFMLRLVEKMGWNGMS